MSKQPKAVPKFASEAEERAFWEIHDSTEYLDWSKSQKAVLPYLKPTTKTISLRLPQHLLDSLKVAANARDVPYQSLIRFGCRKSFVAIEPALNSCSNDRRSTTAKAVKQSSEVIPRKLPFGIAKSVF
jgi:predicted DNA binding CopG/RHH family protein